MDPLLMSCKVLLQFLMLFIETKYVLIDPSIILNLVKLRSS